MTPDELRNAIGHAALEIAASQHTWRQQRAGLDEVQFTRLYLDAANGRASRPGPRRPAGDEMSLVNKYPSGRS